MNPTPVQTAVTAVIAVAAGLLASWYLPGLVPAMAAGPVGYLLAILAISKITHLRPSALVVDTTRLVIRILATTITVLAGLALNTLAAWDHAIHRTDSTTARTIFNRAA